MSDREKLNNIGYIHPEQVSKKTSKYKTINLEDSKSDYTSNSNKNTVYATFTDEKSNDICPDCQTESLYECDCIYKDRQCKNGHIWFIKNGKIEKGDPHG